MQSVPLLYRLPVLITGGLLALLLVLVLTSANHLGERMRAAKRRRAPLGSLETMASGLLGLLLAFNFSIAQTRYDARQHLLVREADAIASTYLFCSVLDDNDRRVCREELHRYAQIQITAFEIYGDGAGAVRDRNESERIQRELWALVSRLTRASPSSSHTLLMTALNTMIDVDSDRRASMRIFVPEAVSIAIVFVCLGWAILLGYSAGLRGGRSPVGWAVVALLIGVVFGVALDFDRPRGFITTSAAEQSMRNVLEMMERPPLD